MNAENDNPNAFPFKQSNEHFEYPDTQHPGMTLRDYFAAHANNEEVEAMIPSKIPDCAVWLKLDRPYEFLQHYQLAVAKARYMIADAMLAAREEGR